MRCYTIKLSSVKKASAGFTLIEVLVAMFIAAISVGAIGLTINTVMEDRVLKMEADKFRQWFEHVQQYAIVNSKTYTVFDNKVSMELHEFKDDKWLKSTLGNSIFKFSNKLKTELFFKEENISNIRLFPNSSYTPFKLEISLDKKNKIRVEGDGVNLPVVSDLEA